MSNTAQAVAGGAEIKEPNKGTFQVPIVCEWTDDEGSICGYTFADVATFSSHVKSHFFTSTVSLCRWSGCDFTASNRDALLQHILFHPYHSYLKLLGSELQAKFNLPPCQMDEQYKNFVPPFTVPLKCQWYNKELCTATFESVGEFYGHVQDHVMLQDTHVFQCRWKGCSFEGKSRSKLLEHCRSHTAEKVAACAKCGSLFSNNAKFKDHLMRQLSFESSTFSCSICFRTYASERLLREHVRRHINTLKCPHCDLTCNGPSRLQHHIQFRHTTDTPHHCPVCQKGFKTGHCLSEHLDSHGQKTFECSISGCKYAGKTLKAWQNHMKKTHIPEQKLYCCHVCGQCFSEGLQLSTHLKTIHGFILPPGHSRFRYVSGSDGLKRLQTVRLDADNIVVAE